MKKINSKKHFYILDLIRGFAILLMFVYHFSYDLNYFGFIQQQFLLDAFWINFRTIIVALFLTIMGVSLYLACEHGLNKKRFQQRLLILVFYSTLVSASSWYMFPTAMIFFGILHFITLASIVGLFFIRCGKLNLLLGLSIIIIAQVIHHPFFEQKYIQWIGLSSKLPSAVDYVPFFPWFGVVLIGIYLGELLAHYHTESFIVNWENRHPFNRLLAFAGRYSLHIYMLHQPLFLAILYIIALVI